VPTAVMLPIIATPGGAWSPHRWHLATDPVRHWVYVSYCIRLSP